MTTVPNQGRKGRPTRGRRLLSMIAGSVLGICSLGLITVGGIAAAAANSDDGYVELARGTYGTDSYALITEPYDWSTATFLFGSVKEVRIRVTPPDGAAPAFVGLARPDALTDYLTGVDYTIGQQAPNYQVTYIEHGGRAPSTPPVRAEVWTAQATGTGTLTLQFPAQAQSGDRILVGMNADGSPSVEGRVETAVTVPSLTWIAAAMLGGGVALLAGSAVLIAKPLRGRRGRPQAAVGREGQ
ncbi:MAG TPA: hypothetical protein VFQ15_06490 [Jiangellaceae bacterium]|nr:hypothetical protein [Jiangellaceae bacterium]